MDQITAGNAPNSIGQHHDLSQWKLCRLCEQTWTRPARRFTHSWPDLCHSYPGVPYTPYSDHLHSFIRCPFERLLYRLLTVEPSIDRHGRWRNKLQPIVVKDHENGRFTVLVQIGRQVKARILLEDLILAGTRLTPPLLMGSSPLQSSLVRRWLGECETSHSASCGALPPTTPIDIYAIDVERLCVCQISSSQRYCALSYVVGGKVGLQLTRSNRSRLFQDYSLSAKKLSVLSSRKIPTVIRDGMLLVRSLGERYLWADSLCIVQDDNAAKHNQIRKMDIIYSHALLTIISVSGWNSTCPLPGVQPNTRPDLNLSINLGGFQMLAQPPGLHDILADSPYESRGWTFQERILSPRCLYLTNWQAYFQCREGFHSENSVTREANDTGTKSSGQYALQQIDLLRNDLRRFEGSVADQSSNATDERPLLHGVQLVRDTSRLADHEKFVYAYSLLVESYTTRRLSFPSDILNAFTGITSAMERQYATSFAYGLPLLEIPRALLWAPLGPSKLRGTSAFDPTTNTQVKLPTWSWAAWEGRCGYVLTAMMITYRCDLRPVPGQTLITASLEHSPLNNGAQAVLAFGAGTIPASRFCYELNRGWSRYSQAELSHDHSIWKVLDDSRSLYQCGLLFLSPDVPLDLGGGETEHRQGEPRKLARICTFTADNCVDLRRFREPTIPAQTEALTFYCPLGSEYWESEVGNQYVAALLVEERPWQPGRSTWVRLGVAFVLEYVWNKECEALGITRDAREVVRLI